jgi:DNA-binding NarL/FixJ family response regulator
MRNVFLAIKNRLFSEMLKRCIPKKLKILNGNGRCNGEGLKEALEGGADLIFMDWNHICHLKKTLPKAKVIVTSDTYDLKREYLSARIGAKGFITRDIEKESLMRVIDVIGSGQIWMTREVGTKVFHEYRKAVQSNTIKKRGIP